MASLVGYKFAFKVIDDLLNGAVLKVLLCDADNFVQATDEFVADVVADELTDASYSRKTLAGITIDENAGGYAARIDATDPVWTALDNETVAVAYIYVEVTNDADSYLVCKLDGGDITADGGDVTVQIPAAGFFGVSA